MSISTVELDKIRTLLGDKDRNVRAQGLALLSAVTQSKEEEPNGATGATDQGEVATELTEEDIARIRSLLTHEDPAFRQQGLELARSIGDWSPVVRGCQIDDAGKVSVPFGELNSAILELFLTAPEFDASGVENLDLTCTQGFALDWLTSLTVLTNLQSLTLHFEDPESSLQSDQNSWDWLLGAHRSQDIQLSRFLVQATISTTAKSFGTERSPECFYFADKGVVVVHTTWSKMGMNLGWSSLNDLKHDLQLNDGLERSNHLDEYDFFYSDSQHAEFDSFEWEQGEDVYYDWGDIESQAAEEDYELYDYCLEFGDAPPDGCPCPSSTYEPDRNRIYELSIHWRKSD